MNKEEELYIFILSKLVKELRDNIEFIANKIDYDNVELTIERIKFEDITENDFSIPFQKQNGSFTLLTNHSLGEKKRQKIIRLLEEATNIKSFASYHFTDMKDINIDHFVYDEDKLSFNTNILKDFERQKQITELLINRRTSPIKNNHRK